MIMRGILTHMNIHKYEKPHNHMVQLQHILGIYFLQGYPKHYFIVLLVAGPLLAFETQPSLKYATCNMVFTPLKLEDN